MSGPSSAPRGEHPGRPGARWETELRSLGEVVCDQDDGDSPFGWAEAGPEQRPNRVTRRAAARKAPRSTGDTSATPFGPQTGSSGLDGGEAIG